MRQGGMVPKNHNSGVYWVRANSSSRKQCMEEFEFEDEKLQHSPLFIISCVIVGIVLNLAIIWL